MNRILLCFLNEKKRIEFSFHLKLKIFDFIIRKLHDLSFISKDL